MVLAMPGMASAPKNRRTKKTITMISPPLIKSKGCDIEAFFFAKITFLRKLNPFPPF
jgi:hypothetical protein